MVATSAVGGTVPGDQEDAQQENSSAESASNQLMTKPNDGGDYVVVGTLSNPEATKPEWVAEVVEAS